MSASAPAAATAPGLGPGAAAALLLIIGTGWGSTVSLATIAMSGSRGAVEVSFWGALLSVVALSLWFALRGTRPPIGRRYLWFYAVTGLLGTALPHALSYAAAAHLPAGIRALIFALIPMATLAMALGVAIEKPSLARAAGLGLGVVGIAILVGGGFEDGDAPWLWIVACFAVVLCYAAENMVLALGRPADLDPVTALWGMNGAALLWLGAGLAATGALTPPFGAAGGIGAAEAALVATATIHLACYGGLMVLIAKAGPVYASQVSYVVAPMGVLWGAALFGEALSLSVLLAMAVILAGLALIRPNGRGAA